MKQLKCSKCKNEFDYWELKPVTEDIPKKLEDVYSFTYRSGCPKCGNTIFVVGVDLGEAKGWIVSKGS